jgi:hypothetical protein
MRGADHTGRLPPARQVAVQAAHHPQGKNKNKNKNKTKHFSKTKTKTKTSFLPPPKTDVDDLSVCMSRIMPDADFQQYSSKTGLSRHIAHWKLPGGANNIDYPFRGTEQAKIVRSGTRARSEAMADARWLQIASRTQS